MTRAYKSSQKTLQARRRASRTHGVYAFERRGEDALTTQQQTYFMELRERFRTEPGRLEYREELAAALAMICDLGFSHLRKIAEEGRSDLWQSDVIKRLATYVNSLTRLIDNWPPDDREVLELSEHISRAIGGENENNS